MDITPNIPKNRNIINGYGHQGFKINEEFYNNGIIITANQIIEISIFSIDEFCSYNLKEILDDEPEILLIGTGKNHLIIPADLKNNIKKQYPLIAIDEMSSASVCRTYNILIAEDRNVAALLMPIL